MRESPAPTPIFDRGWWARLADGLAVAVVASLPWSTSATGILIVAWLLVCLPTLDMAALRREAASAAGGLPVLLWVLAAIGMLWADVSWSERLRGLEPYHKLLIIPLLLAQFRRSHQGWNAVIVFLLSCTALLAVSWLFVAAGVRRPGFNVGVPVKDYISQGGFFTISVFVAAYMAIENWRARRLLRAALLTSLALLFLANLSFVASSRTTLVVIPVLLVLLAVTQFRWTAVFGIIAAASLLTAIVWTVSPYLRERVLSVVQGARGYVTEGTVTSAGMRLEFYRKSVDFIADAPLLGHGTGSIKPLFQRSIVGQTGLAAMFAANPHQQTLAVAIQLGLLGAALLWAMWIAHLLLFRGTGAGVVGWFGLAVVVQNIVGSLFNSHLFDFTQGWLYVFGLGVASGVMLRSASATPSIAPAPPVAQGERAGAP